MGGEIRGFLYNTSWPRAKGFQGFAVIFRLAMFLVGCFVLTLHTQIFWKCQKRVHNVSALPVTIYDKQ